MREKELVQTLKVKFYYIIFLTAFFSSFARKPRASLNLEHILSCFRICMTASLWAPVSVRQWFSTVKNSPSKPMLKGV